MIVPKCADMSEVERRRRRWAKMLRRRTQVFHKHMEVAVKAGS